jgi:hypothetical protein
MISQSDQLRDASSALAIDSRCVGFLGLNNLEARVEAISVFQLNSSCPESVQIHFETAKNLFLYALFVYRFHIVSEQYALISLEFALREHASNEGRERSPGLSRLLRGARATGLISNQRFVGRVRWASYLARKRRELEEFNEMHRRGIDTYILSDAVANPTEEDLNHDWLSAFIKHLPDIRNGYAHGSEQLHATVLWTFEVVSELINQIYPLETNLSRE